MRRLRRGQAMLEYSLLTWLVAGALLIAPLVPVPDPTGKPGKRPIAAVLIDAYQVYNDSYFFALCAPMP